MYVICRRYKVNKKVFDVVLNGYQEKKEEELNPFLLKK